MARALTAFFIAWYALLPPGFCACRLAAVCAAPAGEESHAGHDHSPGEPPGDAHPEGCGCSDQAPESLGPERVIGPRDGDPSGPWVVPFNARATPEGSTFGTPPPESSSPGLPLYLTLRALRI